MEALNTLYITSANAYAHLDHETIRVEVDGKTILRVPLLHLESIVCFGNVLASPALIHRCGDEARSIVFMSATGRFKARVVGPTGGNVLLRRAQHMAVGESAGLGIARAVVAGKIRNARQLLLRGAREADDPARRDRLWAGGKYLQECLSRLEVAKQVDGVRGCEGDAARSYFASFDALLRPGVQGFGMEVRTRRPPRDALNATLSFLYALVLNECVSALEGVGLDPQVGYLHALRPGKPALALDLMEEFRPALADRLAVALINRRQLRPSSFEAQQGGAVYLSETGRREVITAYQKRKAEVILHQVMARKIALGLVPHVQARLLARHLRGDLVRYVPFTVR